MREFPNAAVNAAVNAQTGAYKRAVTIRALRADQLVDLDIVSGRFTCDARALFSWSGSVTLHITDPELWPTTPIDLLTPFGTRIEVFMSVMNHLDQVSTIPFGTYYIGGTTAGRGADAATVTLTLHDPAYRVARHRYESPVTFPGSIDLAELAEAIIADRDPSANINLQPAGDTLGARTTFGLSPQVDPWQELTDTLHARGWKPIFDRDGNLTLSEANPPLASITTVPASHVTTNFTGEDSPNVIVARGSNPQAAAFGMWENDNSNSPTFVGGPFGRVTEYFASPLLANNSQAAAAARTIGLGKAAAAATWDATFPFDPRWDPGDGIELKDPINQILQVDAVEVDATGDTTITGHPWGGTGT